MVRELVLFYWTILTVLGLSHRYFRADIMEWEIITVITMKTPAFDVETLKVRIKKDECVFNMSNIYDSLVIKILHKRCSWVFYPSFNEYDCITLSSNICEICATSMVICLHFDYSFSHSTCWWA